MASLMLDREPLSWLAGPTDATTRLTPFDGQPAQSLPTQSLTHSTHHLPASQYEAKLF